MCDSNNNDRTDDSSVGTTSITAAYSHRSMCLNLYGRHELNKLNVYTVP